MGLIMAALRSGWRILLMGSARDLERGIRDTLYTHMLGLDMTYYDKTRAGDIMAHATSDITHVRMAFGFGIIALADSLLLGAVLHRHHGGNQSETGSHVPDPHSLSGGDYQKTGQQNA